MEQSKRSAVGIFGLQAGEDVKICWFVRGRPLHNRISTPMRRQRNLRGALVVVPSAALPVHVALFDDVMTTGTTLRECARTWGLWRAPKCYLSA